MIVVAAKILGERSGYLVSVDMYDYLEKGTRVHVPRESFRSVMDLTSAEVTITYRPHVTAAPWEAELTIDGIKLFAIFGAYELPMIGYHVPGYAQPAAAPVPIPAGPAPVPA